VVVGDRASGSVVVPLIPAGTPADERIREHAVAALRLDHRAENPKVVVERAYTVGVCPHISAGSAGIEIGAAPCDGYGGESDKERRRFDR